MENKKKLTNLAEEVDKILKEELNKEKINYEMAEARIYNTRSVGVQGDDMTYSYPAEITLFSKGNFVWNPEFLARLSNRITNELREINRVVYLIKTKK